MTKKTDPFEEDIASAFERGEMRSSIRSKSGLAKYEQAARATLLKDRRINIRLSSNDLMDIQARALEEGLPYQTLISSVLHKYVSGRMIEKPSGGTSLGRKRARA